MPANAIVSNSSSIDLAAVSIIAVIGEKLGPHWIAEQVRIQDGASPSYALAKIPMKQLTESAPAIAAVSGSPFESIKQGMSAYVYAVSDTAQATIFDGIVTSVSQSWSAGEDHLVVKIEDDRERMRKWPIIGSFWFNGAGAYVNSLAYRQGWKFRTNPGGNPNCIWRSIAGYDERVPVMCTPWYGVDVNDDPPLDTDQDTGAACYWTSRSVLQYFRFIVSDVAKDLAVASGFTSYPIWPTAKLIWPVGFEQGVDMVGIESQTGKERKADDHTYERESMLGAVQRVLEMAGPYSLFVSPEPPEDAEGEYATTLQVIRTRYDGDGIVLMRPTSGAAATSLAKPRVVLAGSINESSANLYTRFIAAGDLVFIERRVSTDASDAGTLRQAWDSDAEEDFRAYIETRLNAGDTLSDAKEKAIREYPNVGAAYRLDHVFDFQANTSQSTRGIAELPRPILSTVLSNYFEGQATTLAADAKRRYRRPVLFEYQGASADPDVDPWILGAFNDGLSLDADGTIWLPGLRSDGTTIVVTSTGTAPTITAELEVRKLRATVAIPCDHRLSVARKLASEDGDMQVAAQPSRDEHRIEAGLNFTIYEGQGDGDYALEERREAWPVPATVDGSTVKSDVIRDDSALLANHVERRASDFSRLERSGELILDNLMTTLRPGTQIKALDNNGGTDEEDESGLYELGVVVRSVSMSNANQNGSGADGTPAQQVRVEVV